MKILLPLLAILVCFVSVAQDECAVTVGVTSPTCPGLVNGIAVVQGPPGMYTYDWDHDPTLNGPLAVGLAAGIYAVFVTDTSGCESELEVVVLDPQLPPLGNMAVTNLSCAGMTDGTVTFTVNPGPYTWQWVDDPAETNTTLTGLGSGGYTVLVSGGLCPSFITGWLGDPTVNINGDAAYCPSDPPLLTTSLDWGFQPDIYLWSNGATTTSLAIVPGTEGLIEITAIDTSLGCIATGSIFLSILPFPTVSFTAPDSVCLRVDAQAIATSSNADLLVWRWGASGFSNLSDPIVNFVQPYWQPISLQGFDLFGCGDVPVQDSVFVRPRLPANYTAEQVPCTRFVDLRFNSASDSCAFFIGDSLVLNDCSGTYRWDFEHYLPYELTFYSTKPDQCDDTLMIALDVILEPTLFLPTAFTPDGDGINDSWPGPVEIPDAGYQVQLFDRWGSSLWATTDTQERWDGAAQPTGVYIYTMRMRDPCEPTREVAKTGFVTLIR